MPKVFARDSAQTEFHCSIEKGHDFTVSQNLVDETGREFRVRKIVEDWRHDILVIRESNPRRPKTLTALADLPAPESV